jgi:hypothetical protein
MRAGPRCWRSPYHPGENLCSCRRGVPCTCPAAQQTDEVLAPPGHHYEQGRPPGVRSQGSKRARFR